MKPLDLVDLSYHLWEEKSYELFYYIKEPSGVTAPQLLYFIMTLNIGNVKQIFSIK